MTAPRPAVASAVRKAAPRRSTNQVEIAANDAAHVVETHVAAPTAKKAPRKRIATPALQPEERHHLIEVAAYYIAVRDASQGTSSHDHWLQAEREIEAMIAGGKFAA